jgi:photosystem II stability/assembly factor-like uncharacterized protein
MRLRHAAFLVAVVTAGCFAVVSAASISRTNGRARASTGAVASWAKTRDLKGSVRLAGAIPRAAATHETHAVARHSRKGKLTLGFAFPLHNRAGLNALIAREAKTHRYLTRAQIYARYAPPKGQVRALRHWLVGHGFTITHVGADRLMIVAKASTSTVEKALHVRIDDYVQSALSYDKVKVRPYLYYAAAAAPEVPARLGLQTISGLSDIDRFFTDAQIYAANHPGACSDALRNRHCVGVRSGGYFPLDLKSLYDITGHGYDATGQTLGFTLWTTPERQPAMTAYATLTGDTPITVDMPSCTATSNSPTTPSSCSQVQVQPNHLLTILENGNSDSNGNFNSNTETALDIEAAHGVAPGAALKYYADNCASTTAPGSGLTNAGCNGSDVGMEEAMEDAGSDPTLHSVSNSWGYGGEAEWGAADPFMITTDNILGLAAAAGTSFYFSTGDAGTYQSGFPTDSPYVVSVGGTSLYSTTNSGQYSTSTEWSGSGSWCSNIIARPSWQVAPGLSRASCPGRVSPDVSTDADPSTGVRFVQSTNLTGGTAQGQVGGTSLAAPIMNGLQADTQNFVNAQTYPGPTPKLGFVAPVLYQLGNSGNAPSYFRDIVCGNTANPTSGPDGDAAAPGWDPGSGWGEPDWFQFAEGYAITLGATNLSVPPSLSPNFRWSCARTPSNSTERAINCPSTGTCYAVGNASGGTPWYGKFLPSGAWGAVNTFFKSTDGGKTWFPSNSDMFSIACTSSSSCLEVGAGGRERSTSDGGTTWSDVATAAGNNKPLTQVQCPSSSVCYAAGDRGNVMKSTDGGQTWSWLSSTDGNPIYGLSCPSTTVCYATDIYAHVIKTTDGGATWQWQSTPITTPGVDVSESGGPNPFAGLLSISCPSDTACVATGLYVVPSGQTLPSSDPPILTTTDGGATWTRQTSNAGDTPISTTLAAAAVVGSTNVKVASVANFSAGQTMVVDAAGANPETVTISTVGTPGATGTGITFAPALAFAHASGVAVTSVNPNAPSYLHSVSCVPGTTNCTAVGRSGTIVTTTDLTTWTRATSGTTNLLNDVTCLGTTFCAAVGQNGTVDIWNGVSWTATTGNGGTGTLAGVSCSSPSNCTATGKQGVTIATTNGGATWTQQAGGGTTNQMNGISCSSDSNCFAVGNAGTILATTNGGQTWLAQTSGTTSNLSAIACTSSTACAAVGAAGTARVTTDGQTWGAGASGTANALNGVACSSASACAAVGAAGTALTSTDGGATWSASTSGTANALNAISCASTTCYAAGAAGTILKSTDTGSTWGALTSGTTQAFNGVACSDASDCIADSSTNGTFATSDGTTWSQQGNPLSGPTTALNATALALNGAFCTSVRCLVGAGAQGDILITRFGPTTTAAVAPPSPDGLDGWYVTAPTVTLTATAHDAPIASTYYSIDNAPAVLYSGPFQVTTDGVHTVQFWSTDTDGNVEASNSITLQVDLNAPVTTLHITPAEQGGWYASPTVTLTATDGSGSGVASTSYSLDGGPFQTYTGPISGFTTGNHFIQYRSTDVAGNVESTKLFAFKADSNPPTVNIAQPVDGAVYKLGASKNASYKCADKQSGIASCVGTVPSGSPVDTSTIGTHSFTVTGTDVAGNVTTVTVHYTVVYAFQGFFSPIGNSSDMLLNLVHAGDMIKIGFGLDGDQGLSIGTFSSTEVPCPAWTPQSIKAAGGGTNAGLSFGVSSGHYTYGWQTSPSWAGTCREFSLQLDDGTPPHTAVFQFFS